MENILSNEKLCKIETLTIIKWVPTNASFQENKKCFDGNPKSLSKRKSPKNKSPLNFDLSSSKMSVPHLLPSTQDFCMCIEENSDLTVATSKLYESISVDPNTADSSKAICSSSSSSGSRRETTPFVPIYRLSHWPASKSA